MQRETVTFDRVFDVMRRQWRTNCWTEFNFVSAGRTVHAAKVWGHPVLADGMTVSLVLQRADSWSTILGWKDMRTGQLSVPDKGGSLTSISIIVASFYLLFSPLLLSTLSTGSGMGRAVRLVGFSVPAVLWARTLRSRMQYAAAKRLLQANSK